MYRSLVLDISFSPMVTTEEDLHDAGSKEGLCATDPLDSLDWADTGDRTSAWIMSGSEHTQGQEIQSGELCESD